MSKFELSQKVKGAAPITADQIKGYIKERLSKSCKFKIISESPGTIAVKGRVIERLFTPVTKFNAACDIKVDGSNARILVNGENGVNWIFWIFFIVGLFTGVFLLIGIVLYLLQRAQPREVWESILKAVETEFGVI